MKIAGKTRVKKVWVCENTLRTLRLPEWVGRSVWKPFGMQVLKRLLCLEAGEAGRKENMLAMW